MRRLLSAVAPCIVLPVSCFVMLSYQSLCREADARLPLLTVYYLSCQLSAEIVAARSREPQGIAPNYRRIIQDYQSVVTNVEVAVLEPISNHVVPTSSLETLIARFVLWRESLPANFLHKDPVKDLVDQLVYMQESERVNEVEKEDMIVRHSLDCLRQHPARDHGLIPAKRGLPPDLLRNGLFFCEEKIPLERGRRSQEDRYQIVYLLADFRDTTVIWLKRKDRYGEAIKEILEKESVPPEFTLLPALESGYSRRVVSPSMAGGWWQFVRPTAVQSLSKRARSRLVFAGGFSQG